MAKSPRRRANSSKPQRRPAGQAGRRISTMISSGVSAVVSAPWKKSAAWITCAPDFPTTSISASQGSAIANLIVRDMGDRDLEQRMRGIEPFIVFDVAPAHHGAQRHAFLQNLNPAQIGK